MTKMFARTIAAVFAALLLTLAAAEMSVAQAHHSTAHSIGDNLKSGKK